jgi:hypothetical protein
MNTKFQSSSRDANKNTNLFLEFASQVLDKCVVKIFTSQECVTVGRLNLKHTLLDFQNRDIKGATTKIINSNTAEKIALVNYRNNQFQFTFYPQSCPCRKPKLQQLAH